MNSKIGRLYPTTKFMVLLVLAFFSIFTAGYRLQYMILPAMLLVSLCAGTGKQFLRTFFKSIFIIVLFIFLIQVCIVANDDAAAVWSFIHFSRNGLNESLNMTSRIIAISSLIICFFQITSVKDMIYAMEQAGLPKKVTFVIASTIQLIPQMTSLSKTITDAQKSRGIETEGSMLVRARAFIPMLGPLVLSSIQQTEERVLALESRAFSSKVKKTSIYEIHKAKADYLIEGACVLALAAVVIGRMM